MFTARALLCAATFALIAPLPSAQSLLWRLEAGPGLTFYGWDVAGAGDVDGDGHPDLVIGGTFAERVDVRSGLDGHVIRSWIVPPTIPATNDGFGSSVDGGMDATGDGRPDLLVGRLAVKGEGEGHALVFDGASGAQAVDATGVGESFDSLGRSVAWLGDVDGDGLADFAGGAPQAGPGFYFGHAYVFSGASGAVLHATAGTTSFGQLGWDTLGPGDLDGDGVPDAVFSAPYEDEPGGSDVDGLVRVISGASGAVIADVVTGGPYLGWCLGAAGDVNGDGVPDLAVGAQLDLHVISGADFSTLRTIAFANTSLAGGRDLTGDGVPDLLVGDEQGVNGAPGRVRLFSGTDGSTVLTVKGELDFGQFGHSTCLPGDLNGDGREDFAAGAPNSTLGAARVLACDAGAPGLRALGGGAAGAAGTPVLSAFGSTKPDKPCTLRLAGAAPLAPAFLVGSLDVAALPLKGGVLVPQADVVAAPLLTDALGGLVLPGRWPQDAAGSARWFQFWIADPAAAGGWSASNAIVGMTH